MGLLGIWHGTALERKALNAAIERNCTCDEDGVNGCPAHSLLKDERVLNHLVFVRRCARVYLQAEWRIGG